MRGSPGVIFRWPGYNTNCLGIALDTVGTDCDEVSSCKISTNEWFFVAFTYDAETIYIYKNGILSDTITTPSGALDSTTSNIRIAERADGGGAPFDGEIDNVMIFNRALTANEIRQLYLDSFRALRRGISPALFYIPPAGGLSIPVAMHHYQ